MRIGTFATFRRVLTGLRHNQAMSIRAQEQLSSGRRILRPSDDPSGALRAIRLERQLSDVDRYRRAISQGLGTVDAGASALTGASKLMADARTLLLSAMNGTLTSQDRESIASEFDLLRDQLMELGNERSSDVYLFGGSATDRPPFVEQMQDGRLRVVYQGTQESRTVRVGQSVDVDLTLAGSNIFGAFDPTGTYFGGLTGAANGTTANEGTGFVDLEIRHDATDPGNLASVGIALVTNGKYDTIAGSNAITIDAANATIQLGTGEPVAITSPLPNDLVVKNELGAELHLDLTGWTSTSYAGTVVGEASVSIDGTNFTPIDFTETDLELTTDDVVLHVDTTGVKRTGTELVEFEGTTNVFDLMEAIADDLRNPDGLDSKRFLDRLNHHLSDIDRHHQNILVSASTLGARSHRMSVSDSRATQVEVQLQSLLSDVADADLAEVALDLSRSDYLLQIAQAAGARLLQTSLLNYL